MALPKLPREFWRNNPLEENSSAFFAYASMMMTDNEGLDNKLTEIASATFSAKRKDDIAEANTQIEQISTADDVIRFLRRNKEITVRNAVCEKALGMQEELMPLLLRRFSTNMTDCFLETAALIFYQMQEEYLQQLLDMYDSIRSPYGQAVACMVIGLRMGEDSVPFLLREYARFLRVYPEESFDQFPLLVLHLLYKKA